MANEPAVLARIIPAQTIATIPKTMAGRLPNPREKAAIIVRFLLAEGANLPLSKLPDHLQAALTEQMGKMRSVDRKTLANVLEEFRAELEAIGLSFPGGIEAALAVMDGHISANAASRLRRLAGDSAKADPWERLNILSSDRLLPVLQDESVEVAAVALSKLPVEKSAELLGKLPGERARRVAYAVSQTGNIDPETVRRIGLSLAAQLDTQPAKAFETDPVQRVGAILNVSAALTREDVLQGLQETDADFAQQVRKSIFTFVHMPKRLLGRDIPKVIRLTDPAALVTALAACDGNPELEAARDFTLSNMSQRMAQSLREEMAARGKVKEKDAEEAMTAIVSAIRQLESAGELILITDEED